MVLSILNNNINYTETNAVDESDLLKESYIYKGNIYNKQINFVLGKPIFEFVDQNIIYFNIYLVNNDIVTAKIGVYEVENDNYMSLLDSDGDIDLNKINDPLLFTFTKSILSKYNLKKSEDEIEKSDQHEDSDESSDEEDENSDEDEDDDDASDDDNDDASEDDNEDDVEEIQPSDIIEQTKEESDLEISNYVKKSDDKWINEYLKSSKYDIIDNEGGGDCFFAVLRDALKTKGINLSVKSIREKLASEVTEEVYENYKEFFEIYYGGLKNTKAKIAEIKKKHLMLKNIIGGTSNVTDKMKFMEDAKLNVSKLKSESEKSHELEELANEMDFMKDVTSLEDLKKVIKTRKYWADSWAVTTIERLYNVKFIILSKKHFEDDEIDNVLQCGDTDKFLLDKGIFEPKFYIITDYIMGEHYKLITYDKNFNKSAFNFKELPYRIKELVLQKCLEKCSGPFSLIPDFKELANCNNISIEKPGEEESLVKSKSTKYDDKVVIQIYNRSRNEKLGEGSGEKITPELKTSKNVLELNKKKVYPDWRKKLDNDYLCKTLVIDGNNWSSVKHYILANRFSNIGELYQKFFKDNEVGNSIDDAQNLYDKMLKDKKLKEKLINETEYNTNLSKLLEKGLYSKFTQNEDLKQILLLTGDFLINIYKPGKGGGAHQATELMKVRELLAK